MAKYTACFVGCKIGSRTPFSKHGWLNVDIEAENEDKARSKLYQGYENIQRLFFLWPGKQTVRPHAGSLALTQKGHTHYVSTYNGYSWKQTDCCLPDVEKVKAEHLADEAFMNNYGRDS